MTTDLETAREILAYAAAGRVWPSGESIARRLAADAADSDRRDAGERLRIDGEALRLALIGKLDAEAYKREQHIHLNQNFSGVDNLANLPAGASFNSVVYIRGVHVEGHFDLEALTIDKPIYFSNCVFDEQPLFRDTTLKLLALFGCRAPAISLHRATVDKTVMIRGGVFTGKPAAGETRNTDPLIDLSFCAVAGQVELVECRSAPADDPEADDDAPRLRVNLSNADVGLGAVFIRNRTALLSATNVRIGNNLIIRRHNVAAAADEGDGASDGAPPPPAADGALNLMTAVIGRDLDIAESAFTEGVGMYGLSSAGRCSIMKSVFGSTNLSCIAIAGKTSLDNSRFDDVDLSFAKSDLTVSVCDNKIEGGLNFDHAEILKRLLLNRNEFGPDKDGVAVSFRNAAVRSELRIRSNKYGGDVVLTNARTSVFSDGNELLLGRGKFGRRRLILDGFQYETLDLESVDPNLRRDVSKRLRWLLSSPAYIPAWATDGEFMPQPWTQLETVYRAMGRERRARRIGFDRERRRMYARASLLDFAFRPLFQWITPVLLLSAFLFFMQQLGVESVALYAAAGAVALTFVWPWFRRVIALLVEMAFYGGVAGFGYTPWRGVAFGVALVAVSGVLFERADRATIFAPAQEEVMLDISARAETECDLDAAWAEVRVCRHGLAPEDYPAFNPYTYALDVFLPVLELGPSRYWKPTAVPRSVAPADLMAENGMTKALFSVMIDALGENAFKHIKNFLIVIGWVITALTGVAFSGVLRARGKD